MDAMTRALIVIDMQRGFDDLDFWGPTANPDCERNVATLIAAWETAGDPIVVVRHDSRGEASPLHPDHAGNALVPAVAAVHPALFVSKDVNSAFYGDPDLHAWLQEQGIRELVICGIQTNMCVETTARMRGTSATPRRWCWMPRARSICPRMSPDSASSPARRLSSWRRPRSSSRAAGSRGSSRQRTWSLESGDDRTSARISHPCGVGRPR